VEAKSAPPKKQETGQTTERSVRFCISMKKICKLCILGSISVQLIQGSDEESHLFDALHIVTKAIRSLVLDDSLQNVTFLEDGCHSSSPWTVGRTVYE
jgi:hypothetical protein